MFTTQSAYEELGEAVTQEIYGLMEDRGLRRIYVSHYVGGISSCAMKTTLVQMTSTRSYLPARIMNPRKRSSSLFVCTPLLQKFADGSGAVRAGQWARQLIVNESLNEGSQLPYIDRALRNDWGVMVLNTNLNSYVDVHGTHHKFPYSETPEKHGCFFGDLIQSIGHTVFGTLIANLPPENAQRIFVVAHSAGGGCISYIVRNDFPFTDRIRVVALTGAPRISSRNTDSWYHATSKSRPFVVNFAASKQKKPQRQHETMWEVCCFNLLIGNGVSRSALVQTNTFEARRLPSTPCSPCLKRIPTLR